MRKIIQKRKYTYLFSITLTIASIIMLSMWGLNLGIDFKGGTLSEFRFAEGVQVDNQKIQETLKDSNLNSLQIQKTGDRSYLLRYAASDEKTNSEVLEKLKKIDEKVEQARVDFVGGSVSGQISKSAVKALILAIIGIALYIAWAFRKVYRPVSSWHYGLGAIIALAHDILITLGVFSFLGKFYGVEVGVPFIAALLTILGYSVNDTIVVYDRTRENLIRSSHKEDFEQIVNRSLNETLARSINTSLTVIIVLVAIVLFGGESIKYFGIALLVGIGFGTYSSIFVASALLVTSYKLAQKFRR